MRYIVLIAIKIYWLIPGQHRRTCLFKESCSHYVYNITKRFGFAKGMGALKKRIRTCRPGCCAIDEFRVRLADNSIVRVEVLNSAVTWS
jgi:putative component of membrane protein insertase Oxa1/YidC/SpoIIIJ protein YidD